MSHVFSMEAGTGTPLWSDSSGGIMHKGPPPTRSSLRRRRAESVSISEQIENGSVVVENVFGRNRVRRWSVSGNQSRDDVLYRPGSSLSSTPVSAAILFKGANGLPVVQPLEASISSPQALETDIVNFFKCYKCYDLIPNSAKLVVLDTELIVKRAFFAMVDNGVRACPLWDSKLQEYVGMLTITDFIRILKDNYKGPDLQMEAFEEMRLEDWRGKWQSMKDLVSVLPDASLFQAAALLVDNKIHRLPVLDAQCGNVLYILTQKPILRFLFYHVPNLPDASYLSDSISELQIGTYNDIEVATQDTTIITALDKFVNKRISALPIVDHDGKLVDIYSKFDVINLAAQKTYSNLNVALKDSEKGFKEQYFDGVHTCLGTESVFTVMRRIVKAEVHRLVVVDDDEKVVGMITVSDIINYIVLRHRGNLNSDHTNTSTSLAADELVKT